MQETSLPSNLSDTTGKANTKLNTTPAVEENPKQGSGSKLRSLKVLFLLLLSMGALSLIFYAFILNNKPSNNSPIKESGKIKSVLEYNTQSWINCTDIREIIEEDSKLIVACLGGVLITDKKSGEVLDQIGMMDGLGNATATAIEKKGDVVYIGTQDGFTIFNLKTREAEKVSVSEGLVNGSNISLALDGDILSIGTFRGISLYNTSNKTFENHASEDAPWATQLSINGVYNTPNATYFLAPAHAYSAGGVIRFDKSSTTKNNYSVGAFGKSDRFDPFNFVYVDGKVYVSDQKQIWVANDVTDQIWEEVVIKDKVMAEIQNNSDNLIVKPIGEIEGKLLILAYSESSNYLLTLDPGDNDVSLIYPDLKNMHSTNILLQSQFIQYKDGNLWFTKFNDEDVWMYTLNVKTFEVSKIKINRPSQFNQVLSIINNNPIIWTNKGIIEYNILEKRFDGLFKEKSLLSGTSDGGVSYLNPIKGTNKIFLFSQLCGMGCNDPNLVLFNYDDKSSRKVDLSDELKDIISPQGNEVGNPFNVVWKSTDGQKYGFELISGDNKYAFLDLNGESWTFGNSLPEGGSLTGLSIGGGGYMCNLNFEYSKENGFSATDCIGSGTESENYEWAIESNNLYQIDKKSKAKVKLDYPVTDPAYSPFEDWDFTPRINKITYVQGNLWVASTRGLSKYDIGTSQWRLFDVKDGLPTIDVKSIMVDENIVWATTEWGGLTGIRY